MKQLKMRMKAMKVYQWFNNGVENQSLYMKFGGFIGSIFNFYLNIGKLCMSNKKSSLETVYVDFSVPKRNNIQVFERRLQNGRKCWH